MMRKIGSHWLSAGHDPLPERGQRKRYSLLTLSLLKAK
jgi:hypothetical protein